MHFRVFFKGGLYGLVCHHCGFGGGVAYFYRLIFGALLCFSGSAVFSAFPANIDVSVCSVAPCNTWSAKAFFNRPASGPFPSQASACAYFGGASSSDGFTYKAVVPDPASLTSCVGQMWWYTSLYAASDSRSVLSLITAPALPPVYICPTGASLSGSQCICDVPLLQASDNRSCVAAVNHENQACRDVSVLQNSTLGAGPVTLSYVGDVGNGLACLPTSSAPTGRGCSATFTRQGAHRESATSPWISTGFAEMNNETTAGCSLAPVSPTPSLPSTSVTSTLAPDQSCPVGQQRGTINGVSVCKPHGLTTEVKSDEVKKQILTSPAGVTSTSQISESTICKSGSCTTTQVTTSNGIGTTTGVVSQSQAGFCTANPKLNICSDSGSGSFGGKCSSGFVCKGDAIQCALSKEVHIQNCLMNKVNEQSELFDKESAKTGNQTTDLPGNETISISAASFDQSNALGVGASCIADVPIQVMGRSMVMPFSKVCPALEYLGMLFLGVSFVLAARIVTRG